MNWRSNTIRKLTTRPRRFQIIGAALVFFVAIFVAIVFVAVLTGAISLRPLAAAQAPIPAASAGRLSDAQMAHMNSAEVTRYVFDHHGCNTCHTLTADWQLGFNDRGKQLSKGFEGCPSLLNSMNVIAQVPVSERSPDEKAKAARFNEFGCTTCHQILPGQMSLTSYGKKVKSLHLPNCTTDLCCAAPKK